MTRVVTPQTWAAWNAKGTARETRILECLKGAFAVGKEAHGWVDDFTWLFDIRGGAVHHKPEARPVTQHPTGVNTSWEYSVYTADASTRAVDLLFDVMGTCFEKPKPLVREWVVNNGKNLLESFKERRASLAQELEPPTAAPGGRETDEP